MSQAVLDRPKVLTDIFGKHDDENDIVEEFYAVTETSVYRVSSLKDSRGTPIVEKIALRGKSARPVGDRLHGGSLVGIMKVCIVLYDEDYSPFSGPRKRHQRPEEVNIAFWGEYTSPISALCLKRDEAMMCLHSKDLKNCDPRWRTETEEVLKCIGDHHPVFILSLTEAISF